MPCVTICGQKLDGKWCTIYQSLLVFHTVINHSHKTSHQHDFPIWAFKEKPEKGILSQLTKVQTNLSHSESNSDKWFDWKWKWLSKFYSFPHLQWSFFREKQSMWVFDSQICALNKRENVTWTFYIHWKL